MSEERPSGTRGTRHKGGRVNVRKPKDRPLDLPCWDKMCPRCNRQLVMDVNRDGHVVQWCPKGC